MAELQDREVAVVLCSADAAALDALVAPGHSARMLRTAPDEALFVADPAVGADVAREVEDRIAALDADALVVDVSDGWVAWSLAGDDARRAFSYLSHLIPPSNGGFVQGDVARVAAKVLDEPNGLTILVPAYWREHVRERALMDARVTT
ncbi:MAG: hypothetical protein ACHQAW_01915 [Actinomycetota bacterium]